MLSFNLSKTDVNAVNIERKTHCSPLIRDRMYVLHLLNLGFSRSDCASIVGCHINSVTNYIKQYNEGGLDKIRALNYSIPRHELHDKYTEVEQALNETKCNTVSEAQELLRQKFDYNRSKEAVRLLLHHLGFKRRKVGAFPGKANDIDKWQQQQKDFIERLNKLIEKAENQEIDLLFGDAAHFVYGSFSSYCWSKTAFYAPSGHGRYRVNVYGAYDVVTNQVYSMYNEDYIDADFMVSYFEWIRSKIYIQLDRTLHMVLDNARYQHCQLVKEQAAKLNIVLEFLPSYSPNLNLIERLWKYLKKILAQGYHQSKQSFKKEIITLLGKLNQKEHQDKIWTLLNPIFQQFEKSQILIR